MDFTKDIYINKDEIIENSEIVLLYKGSLFSEASSKEIYISYGYGDLWDNKSEIKMKPSTFGYLATVKIEGQGNIQFCFKNDLNQWDNNNGANYILPIKEASEILSFEPLADTRKEVKIEITDIPNPLQELNEVDPVLETSIVSSDTISFDNTITLEDTSKQSVPNNTLFTQVTKNENNENVLTESIVKNNEEDLAYTEFSKITDQAKKQSVKAFDDDKVTAGSVYVNSLVKEIGKEEDEPLITGDLYIEKSLIKTDDKELEQPGFINKIKLAFNKIIKMIKSILSPSEDKD